MQPAYSVSGLGTVDAFNDSLLGQSQHFQPWFPSWINVGTPVGVMFIGNQSGYYNADYASHGGTSLSDGPGILLANNPMGTYATSHLSTYPFIVVSAPLEQNSTNSWAGHCAACRDYVALLQSTGYNIDTRRLNATGYSTWGIRTPFEMLLSFGFWAAMSSVDGNLFSWGMTNTGAGPDNFGPIAGSYYDPTAQDTAFMLEFGRQAVASKTAFYALHGTDDVPLGSSGRGIYQMAPAFNGITTAGGNCVQITGTGGASHPTSQMPGTYPPYVYEQWNDGAHNHGQMFTEYGTNILTILNWHVANPRPQATPAPVRQQASRMLIL